MFLLQQQARSTPRLVYGAARTAGSTVRTAARATVQGATAQLQARSVSATFLHSSCIKPAMQSGRAASAVAAAAKNGKNGASNGHHVTDDNVVFLGKADLQLPKQQWKRLLSLDGGGLRGLITSKVLEDLEDTIKKVLWEYQDKFLLPAARERLAAHGLSPQSKYDDVKDKFAINLADYFNLLAGTSTGGLLSLYFADNGGKQVYTVPTGCGYPDEGRTQVKGSAAGAAALYLSKAQQIFPEWEKDNYFKKIEEKFHLLDTVEKVEKLVKLVENYGFNMYSADGITEVLEDAFGDKKLSAIEHDVVISTVSPKYNTSAFFYCKRAEPDMPDIQPEPVICGLASSQRRSDDQEHKTNPALEDLFRAHPDLDYPDPPGQAAELVYGTILTGTQLEEQKKKVPRTNSDWTVPLHVERLDFNLVDVARATSAAPAFLPPISITAYPGPQGAVPGDRWPQTFVDGGLSNNNPVWLGLTTMLQKFRRSSIKDAAILSIGTGKDVSSTLYNSWTGKHDSIPSIGGLLATGNIMQGLIGMTMDLNGEDKESILDMLYNGLLYCPTGQYLRIQINGNAPDLSPEEQAALQKMDDSHPQTLKRYLDIGKRLAARHHDQMEWWVKCFVFGLEDPHATGEGKGLPEETPQQQVKQLVRA